MDGHHRNYLYVNFFAAGIVGLTLYIGLSSFLFGNLLVIEHILVPTFGKVLTVLLGISAFSILVIWKNVAKEQLWEKTLYFLLFVYLVGMTVFHAQSFTTDATAYYMYFPEWLSLCLLLFQALFVYLLTNLRFRG